MTRKTPRTVCYITGTRADFGLMRSTLSAIHRSEDLKLRIVATGMHLSGKYGKTVDEILSSGLPLAASLPVDLEPETGATMARNIGKMIIGFVDLLSGMRPDAVLLLGDRGEMLAGAVAAIHLNIPVVHIHGGERSGTVDEPVRHAISKLSHVHFTATPKAREALIRMGEDARRVHVTGAPGLDGLEAAATATRESLCGASGLDALKPVALMVYHPVLQEAGSAGAETDAILDALKKRGVQIMAMRPNADAGGEAVRQALDRRKDDPAMKVATHLSRDAFVSWMAAADFMIGNSSAGIIEAASFGTPVINVGPRQNLRERNANVVDVTADPAALDGAIGGALARGRHEPRNIYGDGRTAERIVGLLRDMELGAAILSKTNAY